MKYKDSTFRGELKFDISYDISDVEDRLVPYTRTNAMYRPDYLRFTLISRSTDSGSHPEPGELEVYHITIGGKKLKKDGTPGQADAREQVYNYDHYKLPEWVMPLIQYTVKNLGGAA